MATSQKLELTWVGKNERKLIEPRILLEDTNKSYGDPNTENKLIHGDNLLALKALEQTYTGKVKCIYIDPPYNTGNAFEHYDDAKEHSIWLSLMRERLEILKNLLTEDGVIFIQIDDNEQAYLKVLCDEIFGRKNFINQVTVKMKNIAGASGGGEDKRLKKNVEFILIYAKQYLSLNTFKKVYSYTEIYNLVKKYELEKKSWKYTSILMNEGNKNYLTSTQDGDGNEIKIFIRNKSKTVSVSQVAKDENLTEKEVYYKYINKIFTTAMPQSSIRTKIKQASENANITNDLLSIEYIPKTGKNKGIMYEQFYRGDKYRLITWLKDVTCKQKDKILKKDLQGTLWDGFNLNNLSKEGDVIFTNGKKPEALIQRIIEMSTSPGDLVLDSFLGSGTTAAVAHKMGRRWIGIELGDHCYSHCLPRLKKVVDGEDPGGITKNVEWQGGGGFRFYELGESLLKKDQWDQYVINPDYNMDMLAQAVCKVEGFTYAPDQTTYWKQGFSTETDFIYVTTAFLTPDMIEALSHEVGKNQSLLVCCKAFQGETHPTPQLTIKKIPKEILMRCQWNASEYNLNDLPDLTGNVPPQGESDPQ